MVRSAEGASPDDALHRRANHESPDAAILRDAAKAPLLRMRTVIQSNNRDIVNKMVRLADLTRNAFANGDFAAAPAAGDS
jgi:hypothetical protein